MDDLTNETPTRYSDCYEEIESFFGSDAKII